MVLLFACMECGPCRAAEDDVLLRRQVMVNQFVSAAGCDREAADRCLQEADWQFQVRQQSHVDLLLQLVLKVVFLFQLALSHFFQEAAVPKHHQGIQVIRTA